MPTPRINKNNETSIYFLTFTVIKWIDIFTKLQYFQALIESLNYCQKNKGLILYEYVIMTNHIHLIIQARYGNKISQIVSDYKKHTTREINIILKTDNRRYIIRLLKNSYSKKKGYKNQIWQRENYPEIIESDKFYLQKANYIHNNPVVKGYVKVCNDWIYSSARNRNLNDESIIKVSNVIM